MSIRPHEPTELLRDMAEMDLAASNLEDAGKTQLAAILRSIMRAAGSIEPRPDTLMERMRWTPVVDHAAVFARGHNRTAAASAVALRSGTVTDIHSTRANP